MNNLESMCGNFKYYKYCSERFLALISKSLNCVFNFYLNHNQRCRFFIYINTCKLKKIYTSFPQFLRDFYLFFNFTENFSKHYLTSEVSSKCLLKQLLILVTRSLFRMDYLKGFCTLKSIFFFSFYNLNFKNVHIHT